MKSYPGYFSPLVPSADVTPKGARQAGCHPYRMDAPPITLAQHNRLFADSTPARLGQAPTGGATGYACNGALGYCRAANRFVSAVPTLRAREILREL
jgi:hypothetical protein